LYFWVRGFYDVIFVRRMCAAAVPETEMSGCKFQGFARKDVTWIRAGVARPQQRIDSGFLVSRDLRLYERGIGGCARGIVTARHVHFDVAEPALGQMRFQRRERVGGFHVWHEPHVDLRYRAMRQNGFAARTCVTANQTLN